MMSGRDPFQELKTASIACLGLKAGGKLFAYRNHARPLWAAQYLNEELFVFASTRDIMWRTGLASIPLPPYTVYGIGEMGVEALSYYPETRKDLQQR